MRFPILSTLMVSAMALGSAANAQDAQTQDQKQGMQQSQMQQAAQDRQTGARNLMEKKVIGSTGEQLGQVVDVVIDPEGQARMVVVKLEGEDREVSFRLDEVDLAVQVPMTQDQTAELRDWNEDELIDAEWGTLRENGDYYAGSAGPMAEETAE